VISIENLLSRDGAPGDGTPSVVYVNVKSCA